MRKSWGLLWAMAFLGAPTRAQDDPGRELLDKLRAEVLKEFGLSTIDAEKIEGLFLDAIDRYSAWHNGRNEKNPDRRIPGERTFMVKMGVRLWFQVYRTRYAGKPQEKQVLGLLKDLILNRAAVLSLLQSDEPPEAIAQRLGASLDASRTAARRYQEPVDIPRQVEIPDAETDLRIEKIVLVADEGTSGSFNGAIDANEVVTLNITLKNHHAGRSYGGTSAKLTTKDPYVSVENAKVIYSEKDESSGETKTFSPGMAIRPSQNYTFFVSPSCPDGYKAKFTLQIGDSDHGRSSVDFFITIYNVGPLVFGTARVDDDDLGRSDGNGNGLIEAGELVEYVLALRNAGAPSVENVSASLMSEAPEVAFQSGYDTLRYKKVQGGGGEREIRASFVFKLDCGKERAPAFLPLNIFVTGTCRGHAYSWFRGETEPVLLAEARSAELAARADQALKAGDLFGAKRLCDALKKTRPNDASTRTLAERLDARWKALLAAIALDALSAEQRAGTIEKMMPKERHEIDLALRSKAAAFRHAREISEALFSPAITGLAAARRGDWKGARAVARKLLDEIPDQGTASGVIAWADGRDAEQAKKLKEAAVLYRAALDFGIEEAREDLRRLENLLLVVDLGDGVTMEFASIKPGKFKMGSESAESEKPVREVEITRAFWMQTTEITQAQWKAVMGENPSYFKGDDLPVECVSWEDCHKFLDKLNEKVKDQLQGKKAYLPTEAEWEYACRAGSEGKWCFGDDESKLGEYGWYFENSGGKTHPVGRKKANAWGLYDMHGNVWEWCEDRYADGYQGVGTKDPTGPSSGLERVLRGGAWDLLR